MLCFVPVLRGCVWHVLLLCKEEGSSPVSAITERRDMGLYEVPLSMSLLGFGMGTMLANFHMCGIMLVLTAVFNMLVRNASPRWPMCFRCMIFSLSGLCELLFLLCFIGSWTRVLVSVIVYPCTLCVALLMNLVVLCVGCTVVGVSELYSQYVWVWLLFCC